MLKSAWSFVASDKKRSRSTIQLPVVEAAGRARIRSVPLTDLQPAFDIRS
jgi:hypothetical protein